MAYRSSIMEQAERKLGFDTIDQLEINCSSNGGGAGQRTAFVSVVTMRFPGREPPSPSPAKKIPSYQWLIRLRACYCTLARINRFITGVLHYKNYRVFGGGKP